MHDIIFQIKNKVETYDTDTVQCHTWDTPFSGGILPFGWEYSQYILSRNERLIYIQFK